jgi:hypothetical protein
MVLLLVIVHVYVQPVKNMLSLESTSFVMDFKGTGCEGMDWVQEAQDRIQ